MELLEYILFSTCVFLANKNNINLLLLVDLVKFTF